MNLLKWNVKLIFYISANCLTAVLLICRRDFRLLFLKKKQLRVFFDALVSVLVKKGIKEKGKNTYSRFTLKFGFDKKEFHGASYNKGSICASYRAAPGSNHALLMIFFLNIEPSAKNAAWQSNPYKMF